MATPAAPLTTAVVVPAPDWLEVLSAEALSAAVADTPHAMLLLLESPPEAAPTPGRLEPASEAVLESAAVAVAAAELLAARLNPSETLAARVAVHVREAASAKPSVIWATVPTVPLPATARFFDSDADAVGLAAPVMTPASLGLFDSGALTLAVQVADAASDWIAPPTPLRATTLSAESFSSTHHLAIKRT